MNFFDDTEALLWPCAPWVTYKAKTKQRVTLPLAAVASYPELAKRIKYVKDILAQLVAAA